MAETTAGRGLATRLIRCGISDLPGESSGSEEFLRQRNGLDVEALLMLVRQTAMVPA